MNSINSIPSALTNPQLIEALGRLASGERAATAALVAHLAVFDARGLHLGLGFPSLFAYCCDVLHLSEHETYNRIEAARTAREHPEILGLLSDGALTLTSVRLLAPVLNHANRERLLAAAAYRGKRAVEEIVAAERPRPAVPDTVRRLPVRPSVGGAGIGPPPQPEQVPLPAPAKAAAKAAVPLAPDRYEVRFTARAATCEKLELARDLLRHAVPGGDTAEIVDRALTALLEQLARQKFAASATRRPGRGVADGARHIGAAVKRAVYLRDGGRCAFVGSGGRRCNSRAFLEFHHVMPWADVGDGTVSNIELRCRAHNQYEAKLHFGPIREARGQEQGHPAFAGTSSRPSTRSRNEAPPSRSPASAGL